MNTATTVTTVTRHNGSTVAAAWECWLGASTLACRVTGTAWAWYTQAFFSEEAMRRYVWIGQMLRCLALLAYWSGVYCGARTAAYVESCQAQPEPATEPAPVQPEPISEPVQPVQPVLAEAGIRELRKLGTQRGIKGAARMRKEELLNRLAA